MKKISAIVRVLMLAAALTATGCQVLAAVLSKTTGEDKIKRNIPCPKRPTLILAESYGNGGGIEIDAEHLTLALIKDFKDNDIAPTVNQDLLERLRDADPGGYKKMTIDSIGRTLGARQVVYVHILRAEVEMPSGSSTIHGVMDARVHVVDRATGETLWPPEVREGMLMQTNTRWVLNTPQAQTDVRNQTAQLMADGISKLFYDWTPERGQTPIDAPQ